MAATTYDYTVSTDFPNAAADAARLTSEIRVSSIVTALSGVAVVGDACSVTFKDALSAGDETTLDGLVAAHTGEPLPDPQTDDGVPIVTFPDAHNGNPVVHLDAPHEHDGKAVMVISPATEGTMTWITSHGDELSPTPPATGRGDGSQITLSFTGPDTKSISFYFSQPVELHDGQIWYTPVGDWNNADNFSFSVTIPANTATVNGTNTGNCNLVEIPDTGGTMHVIVPAAGDGAYDIDLDSASPAPMSGNTGGYWEIDWMGGTVSVSATPGESKWGLFDFAIESFFIKRVSMGNPLGIFDIDVYKAEWCHQSWEFKLSCTRATAGTAEVGGWLMLFRKDST